MNDLFDKRLVLVVGKGGVGRSTVAAALAAANARRGKRTLLYQASARDRFAGFFGVSRIGTEPTEVAPNLFALNTTPADALHEYGLLVLRFERVYKMLFENRLTKYFLRAIPGLDDYAVLGKCWYHTTELARGRPAWDTVVFDMPASGHALSMLRIPQVILDTVPDGPLTRDARKLRELLGDERRTAIALVTLAEDMPANEARDLATALRSALDLRVTRLIINQVFPAHFPAGSPAERALGALAGAHLAAADARPTTDRELAALVDHGLLGQARRALNERYLAQLAHTVAAPQTQLPFLFAPSMGPPQIQSLSALLEQATPPA